MVVLPNIDAYMASTGQPGAAVRPTACDNTGVIGGVQGESSIDLIQQTSTDSNF